MDCGVAKDGGGTVWQRRGGGSAGRSHCSVILGHIFLGRANLLNVRAFQPLPVAFELADVLGYVNMSLPFCFCASLPVVVGTAELSLLSGEHKGSVCEVSHNLWFCACPSLRSRHRWWQGGLSNYFTNEKLKPMKMKPLDKGCVGEQG